MSDLLTGPLFSIILTVLAGIALRYALWYGKDDNRRDDSRDQDEPTRVLQETLENAQADRVRIQDERDRIAADYEALKNALDQREQTLHESRRTIGALEEQLKGFQSNLSESTRRDDQIDEPFATAQAQLAQKDEECEALRDRLATLQSDHDQTRRELEEQHARYESVQSDHDQTCHELEEQHARYESLQSECTSIHSERSQVSAALQSAAQHRAQIEQKLRLEQKMRAAAEQDGEVANERIRQLTEEVRVTEELREHHERMNSRIRTLQDTIERNSQRQLELEQQLAGRDSTIHELTTRNHNLQLEIGAARDRIKELQATARQQEVKLTEQSQRVATYVEELKALGDDADQRVAEIRELHANQLQAAESARLAELNEARQREQRMERDLHEASQQIEKLRQNNAGLQSEMKIICDERDDVVTQTSTLRSQLDGLHEALAEEQNRLRQVRAEKEEIVHGLIREQEESERVRALLAIADEQHQEHEQLKQEWSVLRDQAAAHDVELQDSQGRLRAVETERDELSGSLVRAERRVAELSGSVARYEQEITGNEGLIRKLRLEKESIAGQLERERAERNGLERTLRTHVETLDQLRADSQSLESLLERQAAVQNSLKAHADRLRVSSHGEQPPTVEGGSPSRDATILPICDPDDTTHEDRVLGTVFTRPPAQKDDLKEIAGVGEVLEEKLNRLGIYRYEQIMNWDERSIDGFSNLLISKDRIQRDTWVAQARRLHGENQLRRVA